jgi:hypothetical protein
MEQTTTRSQAAAATKPRGADDNTQPSSCRNKATWDDDMPQEDKAGTPKTGPLRTVKPDWRTCHLKFMQLLSGVLRLLLRREYLGL